ncbi:MAG: hypothetical protein ACRCSK_03065 [Fusobacteriaceae bacterium]
MAKYILVTIFFTKNKFIESLKFAKKLSLEIFVNILADYILQA